MTHRISNLAFIGLIGLCFSACVDSADIEKPEPDPRKYISFVAPQLSFEAGEGSFTRAELVDDISQFKVWGYCIPRDLPGNENKAQAVEAWDAKAAHFTKGADVLDGHVVNVIGGNTYYDEGNKNGVTSDSKPKPWYSGSSHPEADDYNYAFIAASTPTGNFSMNHNGDINSSYPVLTFEMPQDSKNINTELDYTKQPDALIGTKFDQFNNSKVKLSFHHIMTGLRFRFYNECTATHDDDKDLIIHKVTFQGEFYKKAEFKFENETMSCEIVQNKVGDKLEAETYSGTFVLLNKDQTIPAGRNDLMRHDGDPNGRSVKLLLLPNPNATLDPSAQEIDDWALGKNKQITIEYSISGTRRTWSVTKLQLKYIPDVNTLHTASFHFVGDDFIVTFQPENEWSNGSDSMLEIH